MIVFKRLSKPGQKKKKKVLKMKNINCVSKSLVTSNDCFGTVHNQFSFFDEKKNIIFQKIIVFKCLSKPGQKKI